MNTSQKYIVGIFGVFSIVMVILYQRNVRVQNRKWDNVRDSFSAVPVEGMNNGGQGNHVE